jgi:hypothetical protein
VVTVTGMRDVCRDEQHARAEFERWPEYIRLESREVQETPWEIETIKVEPREEP